MITLEELCVRKSWNLQQKIDHSLGVIDQFYHYTQGNVYVSFSGGKDSTVLLDLVRRVFDKRALGVYCNTGNEYPSIIRFVRSMDNIKFIHPNMAVKQVIQKYGFPLVSKEQAQYIREARHTNNEKLRLRRLYGEKGNRFNGVISQKWRFLINAPFEVSEMCCHVLKKSLFGLLKKKRD